MTGQNTSPEPGYRGALPAREDRLARPWIITVVVIFALVILLSVLGIPSRFVPDPTPVPLTSLPPLPSASASPTASASESESPSASPSASESGSPSASQSASPAP